MPKRLEITKEDILQCARRKLFEDGYSALTMRGVAGELGVAVGTLYNYFPAKDYLVASLLLEDWLKSMVRMERELAPLIERAAGVKDADGTAQNSEANGRANGRAVKIADEAMDLVHQNLSDFIELYAGLFKDNEANQNYGRVSSQKHPEIVGQIANRLEQLIKVVSHEENTALLSWLLSEALLNAAVYELRTGTEQLAEVKKLLLKMI